jgi:hypothetical protein
LAKIWRARLLAHSRDVKSATRILDEVCIPAEICDGDEVSIGLPVCRSEIVLVSGDVGGAMAKTKLGARLAEQVRVPALRWRGLRRRRLH